MLRRSGDIDLGAKGHERTGPVGGRIEVRQTASDGAQVPHAAIADARGDEGKHALRDLGELAVLDRRVGDRGPDEQVAVPRLDAFQLRKPADVDQQLGPGEPQVHHRDERLAAGQHLAGAV